MSTAPDSNHFSPGFEFLQDLVKNAGATLPNIGQWIAPTINPEEIGKRIEELRTVQFWLEQNARMLGATIQALEVQRMTLSTLQSMNVQIDDLRKGLSIPLEETHGRPKFPQPPRGAEPAPSERLRAHEWLAKANGPASPMADDVGRRPRGALDASRSAETDTGSVAKSPAGPAAKAGAAAGGAASAGSVDPMQWWGALTKQFTELAASAVKDTAKYAAVSAAKAPAGSAIGPGLEGADKTSKKTAAVPAAVAPQASAPLRKRRGGPVR
jgi:hypothetical protein